MIDHLDRAARRRLASAASRERDDRERVYPERIRAGLIEAGDAEADWQAWVAIHAWLGGQGKPAWADWPPLELTAARALQTAEAAVTGAAPAKLEARIQRRDEIAEIHRLVSAHRAWLEDLTDELRGRAAAAEAA